MNEARKLGRVDDRPKRRTPARHAFRIDSAPAKDLIAVLSTPGQVAQLTSGEQEDALRSLLSQRSKWAGGYPFIHDYLVTYGAFDDIIGELDAEAGLALLPAALSIALKAPDRQFHMALCLLRSLIPTSGSFVRPPGLSDALLQLRLRAERLSFLPNLESTWSSLMVAQRHLRSDDDDLRRYTPEQLSTISGGWMRFFPFPLINHKLRLLKELPAVQRVLRDITQAINSAPGARRLLMSTRIEQTLYWVWHVPVDRGNAHIAEIVFIRQPPTGPAEVGQWSIYRQFQERWGDEALSRRLLEIEFGDVDLEVLN